MKIEIIACVNGWAVRPSRDLNRDYQLPEELYVFNDAQELAKHVAQWAKDNIAQKKCVCK